VENNQDVLDVDAGVSEKDSASIIGAEVIPEDGDCMCFRNVDIYLRVYTTRKPGKTPSYVWAIRFL
jgi:hypothetical protein